MADFYHKYPAALRHICWMDFNAIFGPGPVALRCSNLEGGVNIRKPYQHHL